MALHDKTSFCPKCKTGSHYMFKPQKDDNICPYCGTKVLHTNITAEESFLIHHTCADWNFLMAMNDLREKDIIEYQMKISQMRDQAKRDGCYDKPKPKCPMCGCTEFVPLRKKWSLFSGFATNKVELVCKNCGYRKK